MRSRRGGRYSANSSRARVHARCAVVGSAHGRVSDAQPVVGERGGSGHSSPRPRFVDERDELFVRVDRRAQVSGGGEVPAVGAAPKVEPGGMEPRDRAFVLGRVDRGRRRERRSANQARTAADICAASNGIASSASSPRSISAQSGSEPIRIAEQASASAGELGGDDRVADPRGEPARRLRWQQWRRSGRKTA